MKKTKLPKHFFCSTWKMNYYYCIGWTKKQVTDFCLWRFNHTIEFQYGVKGKMIEFYTDDSMVMLIWIEDKKDLGSLVHECVHAANFTLQIKGWKPDFDNDEPLTYLVQNIFEHALPYTGMK